MPTIKTLKYLHAIRAHLPRTRNETLFRTEANNEIERFQKKNGYRKSNNDAAKCRTRKLVISDARPEHSAYDIRERFHKVVEERITGRCRHRYRR